MNILINPIRADIGKISSGYNCINGIEITAPQDSKVTGDFFGYPKYKDFIVEALTHELGHLYTSAGSGKYKSVLFASDKCDPTVRSIIGEQLNGYLHQLYMKKYYLGSMNYFLKDCVEKWYQRSVANQRRSKWLDWFLFDVYLREKHNASVPKLVGEMTRSNLSEGKPFSSDNFVYEILEKKFGITLNPGIRELLFGASPMSYQQIFPEKLEKIQDGTIPFDYP